MILSCYMNLESCLRTACIISFVSASPSGDNKSMKNGKNRGRNCYFIPAGSWAFLNSFGGKSKK